MKSIENIALSNYFDYLLRLITDYWNMENIPVRVVMILLGILLLIIIIAFIRFLITSGIEMYQEHQRREFVRKCIEYFTVTLQTYVFLDLNIPSEPKWSLYWCTLEFQVPRKNNMQINGFLSPEKQALVPEIELPQRDHLKIKTVEACQGEKSGNWFLKIERDNGDEYTVHLYQMPDARFIDDETWIMRIDWSPVFI